METLHFNSRGQWTLEKKADADYDYMSYRTHEGELPVDRGTKGLLHGQNNTKRGPKKNSKKKLDGVTPTPTSSAYASRNPGLEAT
jgi:hypothetical protein